MNEALRALLARHDGVLTRAAALQAVPARTLERVCHGGQLVRLLPGLYVEAARARDPGTRRRAAVVYTAGRGAISHTTALDVWGLWPAGADDPVHLSVPAGVRVRPTPLLVVHQRRGLTVGPPHVVERRGLPVTRLETTIVDSWPLLPPDARPAPLIKAVNERRTTPDRVLDALAAVPRLTGRSAVRTLLDRLASGCHSELEIWGHDHVFTGPGMPPFQRQVRVWLDGRAAYLDVLAPEEGVNFELDGAASHGAVEQREVDLRRDALLAARGIRVVRLTHRRLVHEPEVVRREVLAILASARRDR